MPGKVFVSVSMSLDGFVAPESMEWLRATQAQREADPALARGMAQWMELHQWFMPTRFFREHILLGQGGEEGRADAIARAVHARTGSSVMGKRMFDLGEISWPEEAPFRTPVFVLTHQKRAPWERPGGTTFHFVNDGIERALERAREAAGERDVRLAGGGAAIVQYVNAGLIDELCIALSPLVLGAGVRLLEGVDANRVALDIMSSEPTERMTYLKYAVRRR